MDPLNDERRAPKIRGLGAAPVRSNSRSRTDRDREYGSARSNCRCSATMGRPGPCALVAGSHRVGIDNEMAAAPRERPAAWHPRN